MIKDALITIFIVFGTGVLIASTGFIAYLAIGMGRFYDNLGMIVCGIVAILGIVAFVSAIVMLTKDYYKEQKNAESK